MTTAPAAVHALPPPAVPSEPTQLDLTPLLGADPMPGGVVVLLVLVVGVVVAAVVRSRKGHR